jgi:hypothetical protein
MLSVAVAPRHGRLLYLARFAGFRGRVVLPFMAVLAAIALCGQPAAAYRLSLDIRDTLGDPLQARVRIVDQTNHLHPDSIDAARLCFLGAGGYFYADSATWVDVPAGVTRVTVGRGFEWKPYNRTIYVHSDTLVQVALERLVDLGGMGWYSGDLHAHTQHEPLDYSIPPLTARLMARAEGLSVVHLLDQETNFTGYPDATSDAQTILYYSFEYRNQAYGHVPLPGLTQVIPRSCCFYPGQAWPMIVDLRKDIVPLKGPMIVLGHPHTTNDYYLDGTWPGAGLGRELPVLAAFGMLDAMDVASFSNVPYGDWNEWFDVLSSGVACPASAGTDVILTGFASNPVGGWRVYTDLGAGEPLDYWAWVDALKAGRTFVTNYPLISEFTVGGHGPGDTIDVTGDVLDEEIRLHAFCAVGLSKISILAEGSEVWSMSFDGQIPPVMETDQIAHLQIPMPSWLVAKVEGLSGNPHAAVGAPLAITSAIRILRDGQPIRRTGASGRMLDSLDRLENFVDIRGNWEHTWERDSVMTRIDRARAFYNRAFVVAPNPFTLISPADGESVAAANLTLRWQAGGDPEIGDRVSFVVRIASDSTMAHSLSYKTSQNSLNGMLLVPDRWYWWNVDAVDRGGNTTRSIPTISKFFARSATSDVAGGSTRLVLPRGVPNPSTGIVRFEGLAEPVSIVDVSGRRVAGSGDGVRMVDGLMVWDGTIHGRPAPPGIYLARGGAATVRVIRLP